MLVRKRLFNGLLLDFQREEEEFKVKMNNIAEDLIHKTRGDKF